MLGARRFRDVSMPGALSVGLRSACAVRDEKFWGAHASPRAISGVPPENTVFGGDAEHHTRRGERVCSPEIILRQFERSSRRVYERRGLREMVEPSPRACWRLFFLGF